MKAPYLLLVIMSATLAGAFIACRPTRTFELRYPADKLREGDLSRLF